LPTYNGAKYIRQSIDSCLNQTYKNIELIIIDDGSTDTTSVIIKSYKDIRIKYIKHKKNKGLPTALNTGFAKATGDYLTWTSDDNCYANEAVEKMLSFLKNKNCFFVFCDFYMFNEEDPSSLKIVRLPDVPALENHNDIGACFLYSRGVKEVIGGYDPDAALAEDYDYWIRVSKKFSMHHLNEALYFFRVHKKSLYSSRYYEVKVVDFLVRLKNDILDASQVTNLFINLIAQKKGGNFKLNRILVKFLFSWKIYKVLKSFKTGIISFKKAKLKLRNIVERIS